MQTNPFVIGCALYIAVALTAVGAEPRYIEATAVNVIELLPPPPSDGTLQAKAELEAVLRAQHTRTEADARRAASENKLTPAAFQPVLGPDFTAEKYPIAYELLENAERDSKYFSSKGKEYFGRPRP